MRKIAAIALSALLLAGCSMNSNQTPVSLLTPKGAPSVAFVQAIDKKSVDWKAVDGTDIITAEMVKPSPSYDLIVAPINLGVKLMNSGAQYSLAAVISWGNLYLVGTPDYQAQPQLAAFGQGAVPQYVLDTYLAEQKLSVQPTYFNSVNDVQAQLLSGKANVALLAEPAASATIAKAKEMGVELSIVADLQDTYATAMGLEEKGYPQAAIFVRKGSENAVQPVLKKLKTFLNEAAPEDLGFIEALVERVGADLLGVPSAKMTSTTWIRQNLRYVKAFEVKEELNLFLQPFNLEIDEADFTE